MGSLTVVCFYLIIANGRRRPAVKLLFGLDYATAVIVVGVLMVYVTFGGMIATTWVQIIRACLLLAGGVVLLIMTMSQFGFGPGNHGRQAVATQGRQRRLARCWLIGVCGVHGPVFAGLAHPDALLCRANNAVEARKSVSLGLVLHLGLAAVIVGGDRSSLKAAGGRKLIGGGNMPVWPTPWAQPVSGLYVGCSWPWCLAWRWLALPPSTSTFFLVVCTWASRAWAIGAGHRLRQNVAFLVGLTFSPP